MKRAAAILVLVGLALLGFWSVGYAARVTTVAQTVSVPGSPGDNCSHGGNTVPCRPDPSTNGQDCQDHGKAAGNEDHCTTTATTSATTQTTHHTTTSGTTTTVTHETTTTATTATTVTHPTTTTATTATTETTVTHPTTTTSTTTTTVTHPTTTVVTTTPTTTPTTHATETTATTGTTTAATVAGTTSTTTSGSLTPPPQETATTEVAATTNAPFVPPPLKHDPTAAQHTTRELPYTGAYAMPGILLGLFLLMAGVLLALFSRSKNGNDLEWAQPLPAAARSEQHSGEASEYRVIVPGEGEFASLTEAEQPKLDRRWARAGDRWLGAPGRRGEERDRPSIDDPAA